MNKILTSNERQCLIKQPKQERDKRTCDRIKAALAYDNGYNYTEIAELLLLDDETIRRHIEDYQKSKKLSPKNGGSDSHLTSEQTEALIAHLSSHTYRYAKDICQYIKQTFEVTYSVSGINKWLHQHNFTYKKPEAVPAKADQAAQEGFIKSYELLKENKGDDEAIYFVDSAHPEHQTRLAYGWILKGVRKGVKRTGRQRRVNVIGGINLDGHKLVTHEAAKVDSESIVEFLGKLRKKSDVTGQLQVISDNASYHKSAEVLAEAARLNIKLHYLPPYSPNLNPIERLWKLMHERVTYNQYYEKFSDFSSAISTFFKTIGRKKTILRDRINDKFHLLDEINLAS